MLSKSPKRILITGCGGAAAVSFARSLRDANQEGADYFLIGVDADKHSVHRGACDKTYICPRADDEKYLPFLLEIIKREKIGFIHAQPDFEIPVIGQHREKLTNAGCRVFLPEQSIIEVLQDKAKSYKVWRDAGIIVPENIEINNEADLKKAFEKFGNNIWTRERIGAAGKGSLSRPSYALAKAWIDSRDGWGRTIAAEHLTDKTVTWQSIWHEGKLIVGQGRKRAYWELANRTQSGVTGLTGLGITCNDKEVVDISLAAIQAVDNKPHGIFSVDLTYDKNGVPNPTEINIGRFFTTHHFITRAGCNMPHIVLQLAFGEYEGDYNILNPCREGMCWIRGMDQEPIFISEEEIEANYQLSMDILNNL